jgi:hypothetical protein
MAFVCCASCGYMHRESEPECRYGQPAGSCPRCDWTMYWTDWLDPRRLSNLFARSDDQRP